MPSKAALIPLWQPDWPAPQGVRGCMTTRAGGASAAPFDHLNLGDHVGDDPSCVAHNRQTLAQALSAGSSASVRPVYLRQVHGHDVVALHAHSPDNALADACLTTATGTACTAMVADCLPILLAHRSGAMVGAVHAGWRGLAGAGAMQGCGVLENFFRKKSNLPLHNKQISAINFDDFLMPNQWMAWLGPCIGPYAFEVGDDVRGAFLAGTTGQKMTSAISNCFSPLPDAQTHAERGASSAMQRKYHADLAQLARLRLQALGLSDIYGNDGSAAWCTVSQPSIWFSHRRDSARLGGSGRMSACIWREA